MELNLMKLLLRACEGVFTAHTVFTGADGAISVYGIDLNGDGHVDLASASGGEVVTTRSGGTRTTALVSS